MPKQRQTPKMSMPKPKMQLTPEQQHQQDVEAQMLKFIEEEGIEAMLDKQVEWKLNDINAKIAAQSNIKAWFETAYELVDIRDKGLQLDMPEKFEDLVTKYNDFKVTLYERVATIYKNLKIGEFGHKEFDNPFGKLWEEYQKSYRFSIDKALQELYAWTILEDPVLWASGMNNMVLQHEAKEFVEEETE